MRVYGDPRWTVDALEGIDALEVRVAQLDGLPPGLARHERIVAALIDAGMLAQGILDARFELDGHDDVWDGGGVMASVVELARAVHASHRTGYRAPVEVHADAIRALRRLGAPARIDLRLPEGFAFYAVYPELYAEAASGLDGSGLQVIGIRSIGTTLGAIVAAAAGTPRPIITVRPSGHPFARELRLSPALRRALDGARELAVVDEGPGLSGSSFVAVLRSLDGAPLEPRRTHVFPSHPHGPGAMASRTDLARWFRAPQRLATFEEVFLQTGRLARWVEELIGPVRAPLEDLSGGLWRARHYPDAARWPPTDVWRERRKYLARTERGEFLLKFVGLGASGETAYQRAKAFAARGLTIAPLGLRHGFMVMPWRGDATPLGRASPNRGSVLRAVGDHLAFVSTLADRASAGASPEALREMAAENLGERLGSRAAERVRSEFADLTQLSRELMPVRTDNRMHAWEWLTDGEGRVFKTDLDHHVSHDLVGCQDLAWDLAGARYEFSLDEREVDTLLASLRRRVGYARSSRVHAFHAIAYLAFELGRAHLSAQALEGRYPDEARRLREREVVLRARAGHALRLT